MKKNLNALGKRALALLVVLTMCVSLLQVTAFAAPEDVTSTETKTEQPGGSNDSGSAGPEQPAGPSDSGSTEPEQPAGPSDSGSAGPEQPAGPSDSGSTEPEQPAGPSDSGSTGPEQPAGPSDSGSTGPEQPAGPSDSGSAGPEQPAGSSEPSSTGSEQSTPTPTPTKKPLVTAPMSPAVTNPAGALDYIVNTFTTQKPSESTHTCTFNQATDRCECGELNPKHIHDFGEDNKCRCGEQHEHDWKYAPEYYESFTHTKYCATCGEKVKEACTKEKVYDPWAGTYINKCTLCNYWSEPIEDTHHWAEKWEPDGNGKHVLKCTDAGCTKVREEECKPEAMPDGTVVCPTCGWVKFDDGKPGVDDQCKDGHTLGNVYTSNGDYSHSVECMVCHTKVTQRCEMDTLYIDGKPVTHYCNICGQQKPIYGDGYCKDENGHKFEETNQVLSEDGKSVLTTQTCKICGLVKIQEICHSPSTVIVHYVYADGKQALPDATQSVIAGMPYLITSPTIEGYTPDKAIISGTCEDGKGAEFTVTYTKVDTYTLTIKYEFVGGGEVFEAYVAQLEAGEAYNVPSKELLGYTPEKEIVSGTMPAADEKVTVKYTLDKYTWTINYVDQNGNKLFDSAVRGFDVTNIKSLEGVSSPTQKGYTADKTFVSAPTALDNVTVDVVYTLSADFNLTVIHRYVGRDGTVIEVTQDLGKRQIGDQYTTSSVAREGYTLSATPDNANGVFGDQDVTVTYVYNANAPSGGGGGGGTTPTPRPEDPEPPVDVPDPDVPLVPGPDEPDTPVTPDPGPGDVDIDDPDVPLAPNPDVPGDVDIPDTDVPTTSKPNNPSKPAVKNPAPQTSTLTEIEDEDVPLAAVPQTGDNSGAWIAAAILAACGLVVLGKKREEA